MTELLTAIAEHPLQDVEVLLSLLAGLAFITFLRGFLSGLQQIIQINMDYSHLSHARTRAMWGMMLLWVLFGLWEIIRWAVASIQGQTTEHVPGIVALVIVDTIIFFVLPYFLLDKPKGH